MQSKESTITLSSNTSWYLYNFRASTIRALQELGYRVVCFSPTDSYSQRLMDDLGCEWRPLRMSNSGSNPLRDLALFLQLWRYYREWKPVTALHFTIKNNIYGTWGARLCGVPVINNVSGLGTAFIRKGIVSLVVRALYKLSQPFAHRIFCQNEEDLATMAQAKLAPESRLALLPGSGVDLDRFNPQLRQAHGEVFRFLYAGRMLADKGLNELVDAMRSLNRGGQHCTLWLCGFAGVENVSAISDEKLEEWGRSSIIEWLGPSDRMEEVYANVDCVVLPSYREGMPRSLLEAGAMGLPVIATDVPGCRSVVENGYNGLLCEARDASSLSRVMAQMLAMSEAERRSMGMNGRNLVESKYSEEIVVKATISAIESAVSSRIDSH